MRPPLLVFLVLFMIPLLMTAQSNDNALYQQRRVKMHQQINALRQGALLVKLHTKENTISFLRNNGKEALASKIERIQLEENTRIIEAFRKHFAFCPVYFFTSNYSTEVKNKELNKVVFLNNYLLPDSSIKLKEEFFLIAEFGQLDRDTARYINNYANIYNNKEDSYWGGTEMDFNALIIRSGDMIQLTRPFPYYVRLWSNWFKRKPEKATAILNKKLLRFYEANKDFVAKKDTVLNDDKGYVALAGGINTPVGDFSSIDISNPYAGFAKNGYSISVTVARKKFGKKFGVLLSVRRQSNAFSTDTLTNLISSFFPEIKWQATSNPWITTCVLAGGYLSLPFDKKRTVNFNLQALIGYCTVKYPEQTLSGNYGITSVSATISPTTANAFCYAVGIGLQLNVSRRITIISSYDYVHPCEVRFSDIKITAPGGAKQYQSFAGHFNTTNLRLGIGYRFQR